MCNCLFNNHLISVVVDKILVVNTLEYNLNIIHYEKIIVLTNSININ